MFPTTTSLNLTSSAKDKDAHSSLAHAAVQAPNSMTSVLEAEKDVLHMVEVVVTAAVTLCLIVADTTLLVKTMIVRMMMLTTMLLYPAYKCSAEQQEANVSLVL
jgi:hypothetical protein